MTPITEASLLLLDTDLHHILRACADGTLTECDIRWKKGSAVSITIIGGGYPGPVETGKIISGISDAQKVPGAVVYHAETRIENGEYVTNGGRVLVASAYRETLPEAMSAAYEASGKIAFGGMYYRKDIGKRALSILLT